MRIRKNIGYDIMIMVLFFLLDRTIGIYPIHNTLANQIYATASRFAAVAVIFIWILFFLKGYKSLFWGGLPCMIWFYTSLLFSTILYHGSVYHLGMTTYPMVAICMLTVISCRTKEKTKRFIHAIANLFFLIEVMNFVLLPVSDQLYPVSCYFLGNENGVGYPLSLGLLFCYLDDYFNHYSRKYKIYLAIYSITILFIFSASNVVGMFIILAFLYIKPIQRMMKRIRFSLFLLIYIVVFTLVLFYSDTFLSLSPIKYIVEDVLGKDITLTHRTTIWAMALIAITKKLYFGYGVRDTFNLFNVQINNLFGNYSAHNQVLQTLYEGGIAAIIPVVFLLFSVGRSLNSCRDEKLALLFKTFLLATLVMLMAEAAGWNLLFYIGNLSIVISRIVRQDEADNNPKLSNEMTSGVARCEGQ